MNNKRGFTLIEMLAVIVVLLLLFGMTLKMFPIIGRATAKGQTMEALQKTAFAINEYYAAYGAYPPVQTLAYTTEHPSMTKETYPNAIPYFNGDVNPHTPDARSYGLMAYLVPCPMTNKLGSSESQYKFKSSENWLADKPTDAHAKLRWWPFISDVVKYRSSTNNSAGFDLNYCTMSATVLDGWDRELHYVSKPPYTSYKLWSTGADTSISKDDIYSDTIE